MMSSFKNNQMLPRKSASTPSKPILHTLSPAKHRKLESVMRGMQPGITSIGFGNTAPVEVNELYPMEISKSIPEEKDVDEYGRYISTGTINQKVNRLNMNQSRQRRRTSNGGTSSSSSSSSHRQSPKDSGKGRKRAGNEVPLPTFNNPNKRHCSIPHNMHSNNQDNMMMIDDPNSRYMNSLDHDHISNNNNNKENDENYEYNTQLEMEKEILLLKNELASKSGELSEIHKSYSSLQQNYSIQSIELNSAMELGSKYNNEHELHLKACTSLKDLLNDIAISEKKERETELIENNKLIGRVIQMQNSSNFQISDIWEDGQLFEDIKKRRKSLEKEKDKIEITRKSLRKLKQKNKSSNNLLSHNDDNNNNNNNNNNHNNIKDGFKVPQPRGNNNNNNNNNNNHRINQIVLDQEIITIRSSLIKKQVHELKVEEEQLEHRKKLHIKYIRLMREEKKSRFSLSKKHECYILNERYVLTNLLGKGGFSEVHRGYDILTHRYVACKIHQLNTHWSEERKKNYTKHATREYDIHKSLSNKFIVSLYDVFGIDVNSFCTVLEYCNGMDLDIYLKMNKILTEKESRSIIIQIFCGLQYLHNQTVPGPIIHYDLKPGNLLYKNGNIKLTDFGLAKIINNQQLGNKDGSNGLEIELTSQGAGTYWYLPPECFITNNHNNNNKPIMISPKVDIWSGGVIFYQMLFGKRPFGDKLSQDTILSNKTILNAKNVNFPVHPKSISSAAKQFIQQCCTYNPKQRLSSNFIVNQHPYFAHVRK